MSTLGTERQTGLGTSMVWVQTAWPEFMLPNTCVTLARSLDHSDPQSPGDNSIFLYTSEGHGENQMR